MTKVTTLYARPSRVWQIAFVGCIGCASVAAAPESSVDLPPEAGFMELEALSYEAGIPLVEHRAAPVRMFYAFAPAEPPNADKPLCLVFNGGPGAGSELLLADIGPRLPGGAGPANPARFTKFCHVLFVDARNTGFSYVLSDAEAPHLFDPSNYNAFLDAADCLRVLLRFIDAHPELWSSRIVTVGESYAGVRASALLNLLFYQGDYNAGRRPFRDPGLADELERYSARFLGSLEPENLAHRFGRQVLIQPTLARDLQVEVSGELFTAPDSPLGEIAREHGTTFSPCVFAPSCDGYDAMVSFIQSLGLSPYDYRKPASWLDDLLAALQARVENIDEIENELGVPLASIANLSATDRLNAERVPETSTEPADPASFVERFGALDVRDRYFIAWNDSVFQGFAWAKIEIPSIAWQSAAFGELFLQNLPYTRTFMTRAAYDLVNYSKALPIALARLGGIAEVVLEEDTPEGVARAGEIVVRYTSGAPADVIRAPFYDASHAVATDEGVLLAQDVAEWLAED